MLCLAGSNSPVIRLLGSATVELTIGDSYTADEDAGASATDHTGSDISANIVTTGLPVDVNVVGTFAVTYDVSDADGNTHMHIRVKNTVENRVCSSSLQFAGQYFSACLQ